MEGDTTVRRSPMNAAAATSLRIAVLAAVLGAAAILGLAFGTALNDRTAESRTVNGYPPGWQGVAPIPVSQNSRFSLQALDAVRITRGDPAAPASDDTERDRFLDHPEYRSDADSTEAAKDSFSTQDYADLHDTDSAATDSAPKGIPPQVE
jgi:hypothetical protein